MSEYDPQALNEQEQNAEQNAGNAEITDITVTTAGDVYGDDVSFDYDENREMIIVTAENDEDQEIEETFALPESERSWFNPNFQLGNFKERYGSVPTEGQEVDLAVDDETGYLEVDY